MMMPYQQWVGLILVEVRVWDKPVTMVISIEGLVTGRKSKKDECVEFEEGIYHTLGVKL